MRRATAAAAMVAICAAGAIPATALTPEQIAIVIRRPDAQGSLIARVYCEQRGVPRENIIAVDAPGGEAIAWSAYKSRVVEPLRLALKKKPEGSIRCLLLAGDWPIRLDPDPPSAADKKEAKALRDRAFEKALELYQQGWRLDQMANGNLSPKSPPDKLPGNVRNTWEAEVYYREQAARAWAAINKLPDDVRRSPAALMASIRKSVEGCYSQIEPEPTDHRSPDFGARRAAWQKQYDEKVRPTLEKELIPAEAQLEPKMGREARRRKAQELRGTIGLIRQLYTDADDVDSSVRTSTLDSELVLLMRDNYRLHHVQPNPFRRQDEAKSAFMTCRLDGFDRAGPVKMIEDSIAVEKAGQGVAGKFCLDGQGLPANDPYSYDDKLVLDLADWKDRPASMPVVKEASLVPISPADANPVAFYLGWGTTEKMPAGFTCARGAVAISCAADSIAHLHDARSRNWCNGWLSAGAAAVIGVIDNTTPRDVVDYAAFVKALYVDGQPLVEAYWLNARCTSWRTMLVGDPLYRPGAKPAPASQPAS